MWITAEVTGVEPAIPSLVQHTGRFLKMSVSSAGTLARCCLESVGDFERSILPCATERPTPVLPQRTADTFPSPTPSYAMSWPIFFCGRLYGLPCLSWASFCREQSGLVRVYPRRLALGADTASSTRMVEGDALLPAAFTGVRIHMPPFFIAGFFHTVRSLSYARFISVGFTGWRCVCAL